MTIIEIKQLDNGAHRNQSWRDKAPLPIGWAKIPAELELPDSFPFVDIEVQDNVVISIASREVPDDRTPAEKRKEAYETMPIIEFEDKMMTVDEATELFYAYAIDEGHEAVAQELRGLINDAKQKIREMFPDENEIVEE